MSFRKFGWIPNRDSQWDRLAGQQAGALAFINDEEISSKLEIKSTDAMWQVRWPPPRAH